MRVDFKFYLITDRRQTRNRPLIRVVENALLGGVPAVQLREKDLPSDELYRIAVGLRRITSLYGARLLINGNANLARDVDADGVHLPENGPSVDEARTIIGPERLIGVSCHSLDSASAAEKSGADFITFGPVFSTPSKAVYGSPVGLELLAEAAAALSIPVFGLGGINASNILQVLAAGVHGIALISAVMAMEKPQNAAESILKIMHPHTESV
jgi:thiamine-phosphate pyrophosphorylase